MNRFYYHVLPILGLFALLGLVVTLATQTYSIQQQHAEWVEFTEHWIDQRQEALEDLTEYLNDADFSKFKEFQQPYKKTKLYAAAGSHMMDASFDKDKAVRILHENIGFTKNESAGLVWEARNLRPFLGVTNDYQIWKEAVQHWGNLSSLADSIHSVMDRPHPSNETVAHLQGQLQEFKQTSEQLDYKLQVEVEKATHRVIYWAYFFTYLLAALRLLAGGAIITAMYRATNRTQKKFRALFDQSPDAIAIADPDGTIEQVNSSFEDLFKFDLMESIEEDIDDLLTQTGDQFKQAKKVTGRLRRGEVIWKDTKRFDKQGNEIPVLLSALPVFIGGEISHYFAVYTDVSELKELEKKNRKLLEKERRLRAKAEASQEEFKSMFEHSPVAIALLEGPDLRYTYANEAYRNMFEGRDMLNKRLVDVFPEAKETGDVQILRNVFSSGEPYYAKEKKIWFKRKHKEGYTELYRDVEYIPINDQEGNIYAIQITAVDVTEQVRYREQLKEQLSEKTTLLSEIHHRVKNNLANITGIIQLELDKLTSPEAEEALQDTTTRIFSLADIHELLYQSESLNKIRVDRYLTKLANHFQEMSTQSDRIDVEVDVDPFTLNIDQAQPLGMLLNEIIQNSYKHAFPDGREGYIYVSGQVDNDTVQLEVGDNGVGFEPSGDTEGGLGLSLIDNLKIQLNARIQKRVHEGAHYSIEFKRKGNGRSV